VFFILIDNKNLKAENAEVVNYFGVNVNRKVTADLVQASPSKVNVQFKRFTIGPVSFNTPASFRGFIDVTYLDEDMRLTRGDKGNIFVLTKMK
jgi:PAP_fibrillin